MSLAHREGAAGVSRATHLPSPTFDVRHDVLQPLPAVLSDTSRHEERALSRTHGLVEGPESRVCTNLDVKTTAWFTTVDMTTRVSSMFVHLAAWLRPRSNRIRQTHSFSNVSTAKTRCFENHSWKLSPSRSPPETVSLKGGWRCPLHGNSQGSTLGNSPARARWRAGLCCGSCDRIASEVSRRWRR